MIRPEDVADLQPGDVVELTDSGWPDGTSINGPVFVGPIGELYVAAQILRYGDGDTPQGPTRTLTVASRAPRPLYVNHPRTKPVAGDVVRDADSSDAKVWLAGRNYEDEPCWLDAWRMVNPITNPMPTRLRLLVDGETGMTVPE